MRDQLSVLALSSRFDGRVQTSGIRLYRALSVLALSSRFDGQHLFAMMFVPMGAFSTRSVESF